MNSFKNSPIDTRYEECFTRETSKIQSFLFLPWPLGSSHHLLVVPNGAHGSLNAFSVYGNTLGSLNQ